MAGSLWDLITVQQDLQQLTTLVWVFIGLVVGQGVLSMGHSYLTALVSQRVMADFRTHVFSHLHRLSLKFFAKRRTGELISRLMNDVGVIQKLLTETPMDVLKHLVTIIGGVGFLLVMNWQLCGLDSHSPAFARDCRTAFWETVKNALHDHSRSNRPRHHSY